MREGKGGKVGGKDGKRKGGVRERGREGGREKEYINFDVIKLVLYTDSHTQHEIGIKVYLMELTHN